MNTTFKTRRLTISAAMLALACVLAIVCEFIPFLNLPFGGGFTVASMLPIVIVSYMYGMKWGFLTSFTYSVMQVTISLVMAKTVYALITPAHEDFMGYEIGFAVIIIDYLIAYTMLGFGGILRNKIKNKVVAIVLGVIIALSLRYICHIVSGYIFYGAWADWFFSQEGFPYGEQILASVSGNALALLYSVVYNGLFMIPEIVVTSIVAAAVGNIREIKKIDKTVSEK